MQLVTTQCSQYLLDCILKLTSQRLNLQLAQPNIKIAKFQVQSEIHLQQSIPGLCNHSKRHTLWLGKRSHQIWFANRVESYLFFKRSNSAHGAGAVGIPRAAQCLPVQRAWGVLFVGMLREPDAKPSKKDSVPTSDKERVHLEQPHSFHRFQWPTLLLGPIQEVLSSYFDWFHLEQPWVIRISVSAIEKRKK